MSLNNQHSQWKFLFFGMATLLILFSLPEAASAQQTQDQGGFGQDQFDNQFQGDTNNNADTGTDGTNGTEGASGTSQLEAVDPVRLDFDIPDRRNQGFVGPTAPYIDANGFVGPQRGDPENPSVENGRFQGGDINAGRGTRSAVNSSVQQTEPGFTIQRKSIRARLRPSFASQKPSSDVARVRFLSRISRQPVVRDLGQGINMTISDGTAVLSGNVSSEAEREIIKRQLRLEPGVYRIDDKTTLAN